MAREPLQCPFCKETLEPPSEIKLRFETIEGGRCTCGAVYVYDRTGRNLGEAFTSALVLAYDEDYDKAFSAPEGDYEEAVIRYYQRLGRFVEGEGDRLDRSPKFYFLKRKKV